MGEGVAAGVRLVAVQYLGALVVLVGAPLAWTLLGAGWMLTVAGAGVWLVLVAATADTVRARSRR